MSENKQKIENKINELDEMLTELDLNETASSDNKAVNKAVDINGLDVVDVLHNILK